MLKQHAVRLVKRVAVLVGFDRAGQRQLVDASRRGRVARQR
jgi:hypothetical protein